MKKKFGLRLSLDEMFEDSYYYTEYDKGSEGHYITILAEDKEKFLDAFAKEWRDRAEQSLYDCVIKTYKDGEVEIIES